MNRIFSILGIFLLTSGLVLASETAIQGPFPPYPPQEPPPPSWGDVYGPGRTVRWLDLGQFKTQKFLETRYRVDMRHQFVNEFYLAAEGNDVQINSAYARLSNGQVIELRAMVGTAREGNAYRFLLDYRYSLRIESIEFAIQAGLIGGRGKLWLRSGLAY